jgi:hypothetical protein
MRAIAGTMLLTLCCGLAACQAPRTEPGDDGALCDTGAKNKVYLDIAYAADGTPSVNPASCTVVSEARITWRTAKGETRPFEIVFKGESAGSDDGAGVEGDRYRKKLKARKVDATSEFAYGIRANGHEVDPVIIIDPQ